MWFIGVEVEQEMNAPPSKKNPGSVPEHFHVNKMGCLISCLEVYRDGMPHLLLRGVHRRFWSHLKSSGQ